jgi:aspartate dehydrogenase
MSNLAYRLFLQEIIMSKIGFLGCGKIGKAMLRHLLRGGEHSIAFVQDPLFENDCKLDCPVVSDLDETLCKANLVVECATADVLKQSCEHYLHHGDLLVFSLTAFSDEVFTQKVSGLCKANGTHVYLPHGAILGLDGIFDAREILTSVKIETIKSPKSLGREDTGRTLVYEGPTREVCELYPRNVNVHAAVALAGLGFDQTQSKIISDPAVNTNSHSICVEGEGISFRLEISSFASGGVTGSYTPISACGSLDRILGGGDAYRFV